MLLTEFLDSAQNTEQEARLFEVLIPIKNEIAKLTGVPVVGKLFSALVALCDLESIEAFKQSEHYQNIKGWDVSANLEKGLFSVYPGAESRRKIFKALALIGTAVFLLCLWRRICRR